MTARRCAKVLAGGFQVSWLACCEGRPHFADLSILRCWRCFLCLPPCFVLWPQRPVVGCWAVLGLLFLLHPMLPCVRPSWFLAGSSHTVGRVWGACWVFHTRPGSPGRIISSGQHVVPDSETLRCSLGVSRFPGWHAVQGGQTLQICVVALLVFAKMYMRSCGLALCCDCLAQVLHGR